MTNKTEKYRKIVHSEIRVTGRRAMNKELFILASICSEMSTLAEHAGLSTLHDIRVFIAEKAKLYGVPS